MKFAFRLLIVTLAVVVLAGTADAGKKDRKLTVGAYLSSAKIEIISGDMERYPTAIAYLDSLFLNYGPHGEGLHLMSQVMVDYIDKNPDPHAKMPFIEKFVAYVDSLHMCCENKDINKKYRKDCDKFTQLSDSTAVRFWRDFYNLGLEQMTSIDRIQTELASEADSAMRAAHQRRVDVNLDSCVTNMQLAIIVDPADYRPYVAIGSVYDKVGDYKKAVEWTAKGLEITDKREKLLFSVAYYYIQLDDFCSAIPYLKEHVEFYTDDTVNLSNLAICYNNCGFYDSAAAVNQKVLEMDPTNLDVLVAVGLYFNQIARNSTDSATYYQQQENEQAANYWRTERDRIFDSSLVYFERAVTAHPDNIPALEQYGTIAGLKGKYDRAAETFSRLAELRPSSAEYARAAGDFYLRQKQFSDALAMYEKTVERDPGDAETWERLVDLYHNEGKAQKEVEAKKKLEGLK